MILGMEVGQRGPVQTADDLDFQLFFEKPPTDQGERWSFRNFRSYTTVRPPFGASIDPVGVRKDKLRFVENIWAAQAQARAKLMPKELEIKEMPRVMVAVEESALDTAGEPFGRAKLFLNVWSRQGYASSTRRGRVVIHLDESGDAPDLSLGEDDKDPAMVIKLQPMPGNLCRFSYTTETGDTTRELLDFGTVSERIASISEWITESLADG